MSDPREPIHGQSGGEAGQGEGRSDAEEGTAPTAGASPELSEEDLEFIREAKRNFAERYARPKVSKKMQEKMQSGVSDLD